MRFGAYEVLSKIATGGMSEVFLARPVGAPDASRVVVKRILPSLASDERFLELFKEEGRISSLMAHPNVVRVLGTGTAGRQPYLVMEYVDGVDCWRMVHRAARAGREPPARAAVFIACEILKALGHVHTATDEAGAPLRVVHGDVSPTNIYISRKGEVKLGDFGIARARHREAYESTTKLHGKVAYLAPELVVGGDADHRADIFSVGIVLTELLIQTRLFGGGSQLTTLLAIRDARLDALEANIGKVPEGVRHILRRALARDRDERFSTAPAMCRALERFLGGAAAQELRAELADLVAAALERDDTSEGADAAAAVDANAAPGLDGENPLKVGGDVGSLLDLDLGLDDPGWAPPSFSPPPPALQPTPAPIKLTRIADDEQLVQEELDDDFDIDLDFEVEVEPEPEPARESLRQTQQPPPLDKLFAFRRADGAILGPFDQITAIEKVIADQIRSHYEVSVNGGPFRPLAEIRELARHAPSLTPVTTELGAIGPPDRRGIIGPDEPVWTVLYDMALARETGVVLFDHEVVRKEVYLRDGQLHYVSSNVSSELLGKSLVDKGVITQGQLDLALKHLARFNNHLGDALVGLGVLDAVTLFRYIQGQVQDKLLDVFAWQSGEYSLYRGVVNPDAAFPLHIDVLSILWPGMCHGIGNVEASDWLEAREGWLVTPVESASALRALGFPERIETLLSGLVEALTVKQLARLTGDWNLRFDLARALRCAADVGLLDLAPAES